MVKTIYKATIKIKDTLSNRWFVCDIVYLEKRKYAISYIKDAIKKNSLFKGENWKYKIEQFKVVKGGNVKWN